MSSLVAAGTSSGGPGSLLIFALPVLLIGFMFMTQRRRTKAAQSLQSTLAVGDEVTTTSGMLGRIIQLDDKIATLEVSPGVSVRFDRRAVAGPAPTPSASSDSQTYRPSDPTSLTD
jgi:preprotein translocase subunit YajC